MFLTTLGAADNFMSKGFVVGRNTYEAPARGGSLTSEWRASEFDMTTLTTDGRTTPEQLWASLKYFLDAVIPTAEECGVFLAMHPDDPPMAEVRGAARIMTSPEAFEKLIALNPSPHNGITFCQGCFSEMGVDVPDAISRLGHRAHFVHFRDVKGNAEDFIETWQDEGQTDMHKVREHGDVVAWVTFSPVFLSTPVFHRSTQSQYRRMPAGWVRSCVGGWAGGCVHTDGERAHDALHSLNAPSRDRRSVRGRPWSSTGSSDPTTSAYSRSMKKATPQRRRLWDTSRGGRLGTR
jgi:hypothetical protein